jgi:acyl-CoA reductase-like NAD-dependent aldehyde dehydrogenase
VVQILRDALEAEGHDEELVQVVQGDGATGRALIESGVDVLVFIGSVENGRRVLSTAAQTLTPVILELGGKDPFIVCDDANLEAAVHGALAGTFINCGQNCVASERVLVQRGIAKRFEEGVAAAVGAMRQGPSRPGEIVDVGAMATPLQLQVVERLVTRAIEQGARVVSGGKRVRTDQGEYFAPTILADVTPSMDIMREETFGPVLLISPFERDEDAIAIANGTSFGLGSSVFSGSRARARRIASALEAGMTGINDFGGMTYMAQDLTFGGVKHSGFGRINGREGLRALCNTKAVLDDRLPFSFASKVYPVSPRDFGVTQGTLDVIYGRGVGRRLRGLGRMVRSMFTS